MHIIKSFISSIAELMKKREIIDESDKSVDSQINTFLLEEYRVLSAEILKRVELQQRILRLYIMIFAAILAAITHFLSAPTPDYNAITFFSLFSCLPFYFLSWSFVNHDFMICAIAKYLNNEVCHQIKNNMHCNTIFNWESFLSKERNWRKYKFPISFIYGEENLLPIIIPSIFTLLAIIFITKDVVQIIKFRTYYMAYIQYFIYDPSIVFSNIQIRFIFLAITKIIILIINFLMIISGLRMHMRVRKGYKSINKSQ